MKLILREIRILSKMLIILIVRNFKYLLSGYICWYCYNYCLNTRIPNEVSDPDDTMWSHIAVAALGVITFFWTFVYRWIKGIDAYFQKRLAAMDWVFKDENDNEADMEKRNEKNKKQ